MYGTKAYGAAIYGDTPSQPSYVALADAAVLTDALSVVTNTSIISEGIFPVNAGGLNVQYSIMESSNANYDIMSIFMVGNLGRKIR